MLQTLKKTPNIVSSVKGKFKFPEKYKGTLLEKWANYWKNLYIDYRQMLQDVRTDIQDEPVKALKWTFGIGGLYVLAKNNPDELDFRDQLKRISNELVMVSEECLNKKSADHLRFIDTCYNQGVIHYGSLGIMSVMYTTELSDSCDLYKAHCSYLKPTYLSLLSRIVDVGIMGRWWNLHIKTTNYDVNF